jgi:hypothetical protein
MKRHLDSDVVRLSGVEALIGKDVEIIVLEDSSIPQSADAGSRKRIRGSAKGKVWISPDFDKPLPADVLSEFSCRSFRSS